MTMIGTIAVAALLTLGGPAVSTAERGAPIPQYQQTKRSWQFDRGSITRDHWTARHQRLDRMRQRLQTRARVRALARVFHRARMKVRWWHNEGRRRQDVFDRLDRNRDGVLSTDELQRPRRSRPLR